MELTRRALRERGAVDEDYVREQTDLPFLVREDTKRFLRQSDLEEDGQDDIFYVYDLATKQLVEAPTRSGAVRVRPVMEHLREHLATFTPEYVEEITGVGRKLQDAGGGRLPHVVHRDEVRSPAASGRPG
jgi:anaerobic selenocysteine-containing dehydrogenase